MSYFRVRSFQGAQVGCRYGSFQVALAGVAFAGACDASGPTLPDSASEPATPQGTWTIGEPSACTEPLDAPGWTDASARLGGADPYAMKDATGSLFLRRSDSTWEAVGSQGDMSMVRLTLDGAPRGVDPGLALRAAAVVDLDHDDLPEIVAYGEGAAMAWDEGPFTGFASFHDRVAIFDASVADYDGDGDEDLLTVTAQADRQVELLGADLYRNAGGHELGPAEHMGPDVAPFGMAFELFPSDWDHDGDLDVYVCNDFGPTVNPNLILVNDGNGTFSPGDARGADVAIYCMGVSAADFDQDGRLDLYEGSIGSHHLLVDTDAGFVDAAEAWLDFAPVDPQMVWGSAAVDVDNDGLVDILAATGDFTDGEAVWPIWYLHHDDDGVLRNRQVFAAETSGRAVVARDLNGDGVVDVLVAAAERPPWLYLSTGCTADSWLEVEAPTGTRVTVEAGGRSWLALATAEPGYAAGAPSVAHVGLGEVDSVDRVVLDVPWVGIVEYEGPLAARRKLEWSLP